MLLTKSRFTMAGASTLPTTIDAPIKRVPAQTAFSPRNERTKHPTASTISAQNSTRSVSNLAVSELTKMLNSANAKSGKAPRSPCSDSPHPKAAPMLERSGPTATIAGRKFSATRKITPLINKAVRFAPVLLSTFFSSPAHASVPVFRSKCSYYLAFGPNNLAFPMALSLRRFAPRKICTPYNDGPAPSHVFPSLWRQK